jgi:hypothetical protein
MPGGEFLIVGSVAHCPIDFGRQHDLLAPPAALGQPAADVLLGDALALPPAIDVAVSKKLTPNSSALSMMA